MFGDFWWFLPLFTYIYLIYLIFMVHGGKDTIHRSYGLGWLVECGWRLLQHHYWISLIILILLGCSWLQQLWVVGWPRFCKIGLKVFETTMLKFKVFPKLGWCRKLPNRIKTVLFGTRNKRKPSHIISCQISWHPVVVFIGSGSNRETQRIIKMHYLVLDSGKSHGL